MRRLPVSSLSLSVLLAMAMGCNEAPPRCPAVSNVYLLNYRYLDGDGTACAIGPYQLTVDGGGSGVKNTTDKRADVTIYTEVHLRGCSLSLQVDVTNTKTTANMSSVSGDLTVYSASNISGIGVGTKYSSDGRDVECQGQYEMTLQPPPMDTSSTGIGGMPATL